MDSKPTILKISKIYTLPLSLGVGEGWGGGGQDNLVPPPPSSPEGVKKLLWSTFVPKGRVNFQNFRMRSLRLRVTRHGNKDTWLSELTAQWFNFQRLRSKASPIHPSFPFERCSRFFHTSPPTRRFLGGILGNLHLGFVSPACA